MKKHGKACDCAVCHFGKKLGIIKNGEAVTEVKIYVCGDCGSRSEGTPGECHGRSRGEVK